MVPIIDPEDDYLTIAAAEEQMALAHDARQKELHEAHTKLKRKSCSTAPVAQSASYYAPLPLSATPRMIA